MKFLFHLDLYRIENAESAMVFGMDEYLKPEAAITIIEWAERVADCSTPGWVNILLLKELYINLPVNIILNLKDSNR